MTSRAAPRSRPTLPRHVAAFVATIVALGAVAAACSSGDGRRLVEPSPTSAATSGSFLPTTTGPAVEPGATERVDPTTSLTAGPSTTDVATDPTASVTSAPMTAAIITDPVAAEVLPQGFHAVRATVTTAESEVCELCVWVAETAEQRSRGLMGVTGLGEADAMAFRYDAPTTAAFWMKDTLLPLSIAFFDIDGTYLDAFDMEPCESEPCETYPTPPDFVVAVEFRQGDLDAYGVGPGSRFDFTDLPCR